MRSKLTTEVMYLLRRLMELYKDRKEDLHMVFIDLKKEYNKILCDVLWRCLEEKGMSLEYIQVIKDKNKGGRMRVSALGGVIEDFLVGIGLH